MYPELDGERTNVASDDPTFPLSID